LAVAVTPAYARATAMLDAISWRGIKPGLERTRALLRALGEPQEGLSGVLVAGTNGKGSVCAIVDSITRAAGLRTVMLTKPHLISYTERMVVDGRPVTEDDFGDLMDRVGRAAATLADDLQPTGFEMLTAAGILRAAIAMPDVLVCEVGLGGRLDSTNVLDLGVAVITNVALDHRELLGDTIPAIAREKAAIIKTGNAAVTGAREPALAVIRHRADEVGATLRVVHDDGATHGTDGGLHGVDVTTRFAGRSVTAHAPLVGAFQIDNVATAVAACDALRERGARIDAAAVVSGAARTEWRGRMQWFDGAPAVLVDGAHNPAGVAAMASAARDVIGGRRAVLVFGAMRNKDIDSMIDAVRSLGAAAIVVTAAAVERADDVDDLRRRFGTADAEPTVAGALARARRLAGRDGVVVVSGSLYLAGEALSLLEA
jgi:dihydrofolate synthase / folylpolyglutamate synthase